MMNNRQNSAFEELIQKEQRTKARWQRTHGRAMALESGVLPDSGMMLANDEFMSATAGSAAVPLPRPDPAAAAALASASFVGRPRFADSQAIPRNTASNNGNGRTQSPRPSDNNNAADNGGFDACADPFAQTVGECPVLSDAGFPLVRKKVVRTVEVPVTRTVKVPIKLAPSAANPERAGRAFHVVNESYTDYVERPAVRHREVWVKRVVPEQYLQRVPVTRTRQIKVPVAEGAGYSVVPPQQADAWRIDQVQETKLVEVEEWADFELRPVPVTRPVPVAAREIPMERGPYTASNPRQVLKIVRGSDPAHETVREVDQSPVVASAVFEPANNGSAAAANTRTSGAARGSGNPKRSQTQRAGGVKGFSGSRTHALAATNGAIHSSDLSRRAPPAPSAEQLAAQRRANAAVSSLGFTGSLAATLPPAPGAVPSGPRVGMNAGVAASWGLRTVPVGADGPAAAVTSGGVRVVGVTPLTAPAVAGLQVRDVITHVNARPTPSPEALARALDGSDGPVALSVVRGAIKMKVVVMLSNKNKGY